ncbi:MAG TPA: hypothetical protein VNB90_05790 [Cytophagaceae bacterium]|nr:hypothetical protein [Cytophagaceae bacterium]
MALISVILIVAGFLLSVYAGIVLSLSEKVQTTPGQLNNPKIVFFSILMSVSVLMVLAGVLGYYWLRGNLPYYMN